MICRTIAGRLMAMSGVGLCRETRARTEIDFRPPPGVFNFDKAIKVHVVATYKAALNLLRTCR